jgi:hypothetical protein
LFSGILLRPSIRTSRTAPFLRILALRYCSRSILDRLARSEFVGGTTVGAVAVLSDQVAMVTFRASRGYRRLLVVSWVVGVTMDDDGLVISRADCLFR